MHQWRARSKAPPIALVACVVPLRLQYCIRLIWLLQLAALQFPLGAASCANLAPARLRGVEGVLHHHNDVARDKVDCSGGCERQLRPCQHASNQVAGITLHADACVAAAVAAGQAAKASSSTCGK